MSNPWIPAEEAASEPAAVEAPVDVAPVGATAPQERAVEPPPGSAQLPTWEPGFSAPLWVVGAHGGAAETTVADLLGGVATTHRWPWVRGLDAPVLLTARTHPAGLGAAQAAMRTWAAGAVPGIRLLGLLLVADAPGRLPKPWRAQISVLAGGVPNLWHLGWSEHLRAGDLAHPSKEIEALRSAVGRALTSPPR